MKQKIVIGILFLHCLFFITACQKDLDKFVADPLQPNINWTTTITEDMPVSLLRSSLQLPVFTDSFTLDSTTILVQSLSGLRCTFSPYSLANTAGQVISGNMIMESLLLNKKGAMIRMDRPTTTDGNILVSGGELFLNVRQQSTALSLTQQNTVSINYYDSTANTGMKLLYGVEPIAGFFNWISNADSISNTITTANNRYSIRSQKTGWIAAGMPVANPGQATVSLSLPVQYTNANAMAYLIRTDALSVVKMTGDANSRKFVSNGLPYGASFVAILISKQGNNYFLGYQNFVTTAGSAVNTVVIEPTASSFNTISAYLDGL
jgi:hypothetical protein